MNLVKKINYIAILTFSLVMISSNVMALEGFGNANTTEITSLNVEGVSSDLFDVFKSNNKDKPISCGLFRMGKGKGLDYEYKFDEGKILLEGDMTIVDSNGKKVELKPGDMVLFNSGDKVTFSSNSSGLAFYCAQR